MNVAFGFHAIGINGHVGNKTVHILIDTRSTHKFLDLNLAKRMGYSMESIALQAVTRVDRN